MLPQKRNNIKEVCSESAVKAKESSLWFCFNDFKAASDIKLLILGKCLLFVGKKDIWRWSLATFIWNLLYSTVHLADSLTLFTLLCGAFIKPFEAPQRSLKIKI